MTNRADLGPMYDHIVRGAHRLLLGHGETGLTVDQIADRLQIAKKTIYNHFATKRSLVEAVLRHDTESWLTHVSAIMDDPEIEFAEKVSRLMTETLEKLRERDRILPSLRGIREEVFELRTQSAFQRELVGPISRLIRQGEQTGHVRAEIEPELLAYVLLNMTSGALSLAQSHSVPYGPFELLLQSLRLLATGILTEKGRQHAAYLEHSPCEEGENS